MKRIVMVAPYFPPSNLTGVHRSRMLAAHLGKFGWEPTVLSVRPEYYEEPLDPDLEKLIPDHLNILRTRAFKTRPIRMVGDLSIRCFFWHWRELRRLCGRKMADFVFVSLFPAYSTLLARLVNAEFGIPYGIDYQDPWIEYGSEKHRFLSKKRLTQTLARLLEPVALKKVRLLSTVAGPYLKGVLDRNPHLRSVPTLVFPIGIEPADHAYAANSGRNAYLFGKEKGCFDFVYAGAFLPRAERVWDCFFRAIREFCSSNARGDKRIRIHCIGTGLHPNRADSRTIRPVAEKHGLYGTAVFEYPARIPYVDVLTHLAAADGILVVGSLEKHYTASKIFQAVFSKKPILALLHAESTARRYLDESRAGLTVCFENADDLKRLQDPLRNALTAILAMVFDERSVDYGYFAEFTAEAGARKYAAALDKIVP